mgnify:CR=1 FL=1
MSKLEKELKKEWQNLFANLEKHNIKNQINDDDLPF